MNHTPTPFVLQPSTLSPSLYIVGMDGMRVAVIHLHASLTGSLDEANAEFIVLACNSFDALVEALDQMVKAVAEPAMISMGFDHPPEYASEADHWLAKAIFDARNLLASIKGEKKQ